MFCWPAANGRERKERVMRNLLILLVSCLVGVEANAQVKEKAGELWGKTKQLGSDALQSVQKKYGELREGRAEREADYHAAAGNHA